MKSACSVLACAIAMSAACGKGSSLGKDDAGTGDSGGAASGGGRQTGGVTATGGATGTGGMTGSGGMTAIGGAPGTGGAKATGGATGSGGGTASDAGLGEVDAGVSSDGATDTAPVDGGGGATDVPIVGKARCRPGPFPAPVVQSTRNVCANFAFNHTFNEGPTWVASQNAFFFSNFVMRQGTGGDIIKYTPGGTCEVFIRDVGCNGLAVSLDGNLLGACHQSRSVVRFDLATKQATTVADGYLGRLFDTPNDLIVHSNGTIYFTNPSYELDGRPPGVGLSVFRIDPAGALSMIAQGACNGIGLSPDERKLYVLQSGVWDLDAQGVPSNRANLFTGGDGMAVDCAGNLYAAGTIFSPQGQRLGSYGAGTNLAFGGSDGTTVLVVGPNVQVRELQLNLPGLP